MWLRLKQRMHLDLFTAPVKAKCHKSVYTIFIHQEQHLHPPGTLSSSSLPSSTSDLVTPKPVMCIHLVRQKVMLMYVQHKYYVHKTCGCTKANRKPSSILFSVHYIDHRAQASLLTWEQLHLVFLGSIVTTVLDRDSIVTDRHKPDKQKSTIKPWLQSV